MKQYNLARMHTATTGTGTITLTTAVSGYLTFALAGVTTGKRIPYGIRDGASSETGEGVYTTAGLTLTRAVITNSTNGGSAISLSGTAEVFIGPRANEVPYHLLASGTVSAAATLDLVLTNYTDYRGFLIFISGFRPATDGADLQMRFSSNGGSTYDAAAANYQYTVLASFSNTDGTAFVNSSASDTSIIMTWLGEGVGNATNEGLDGQIEIQNQTSTAFWTRASWRHAYMDDEATSSLVNICGTGIRSVAQDTDAIRLMFSTGNITVGNYALYGLT